MITSIFNTYKDLISYLKKPEDKADEDQSNSLKVRRLFSLLAIEIPVMMLLMAAIYGIEQAGLIDAQDFKLNEYIDKYPLWLIAVFGALIIPFVEELGFRFYLRYNQNYLLQLFLRLLGFLKITTFEKADNFSRNLWNRYYTVVFYFSALMFGFIHIINYEYSHTILLLSPILLAPQLVMGALLGYLRVKYGFIWGYFLHALHNGIFILIPFIFMAGTVEVANIENEQYNLKIEEVNFQFDKTRSFSESGDSINIQAFNLKDIIYSFDKGSSVHNIEIRRDDIKNLKLNIDYKGKTDTLDSKNIILKELEKIYEFEIIEEMRNEDVFYLQIADSTKLHRSKVENPESESSKFITSNDSLKFESVFIDMIAKNMGDHFEENIICEIEFPGKFNVELPSKDFNKAKRELESEYGIKLVSGQRYIEFVIVE